MWMVQVAAYTSGRLAVNKFDCLLLQHILWQRPDEAQRINDFLLERLAADSSTQQTDYLFNGACLCSGLGLLQGSYELYFSYKYIGVFNGACRSHMGWIF